MKKIILVFIVIIISAWTQNIREQKNITGWVYSSISKLPIEGVQVLIKGTSIKTSTDKNGYYALQIYPEHVKIIFSHQEYIDQEINIGNKDKINVYLVPVTQKPLVEIADMHSEEKKIKGVMQPALSEAVVGYQTRTNRYVNDQQFLEFNTEDYSSINENIFHEPSRNPLSTFSIDVDAASYSNVRRFINGSQLPPKDAVRIEELINYFSYDYSQPSDEDPFSVNTEVGQCPWNKENYLVHIGLQGKILPTENLPPSNLVFLIDVSGSMNNANKLPLLKSAFKLLVEKLRPQDKVSIVVYAGAAGLVLPPTPGDQKSRIISSLDNLQAGGSTAGGQGIMLAYQTARDHFIKGGNNRVILATDGDFNVGVSSNAGMEELIEKERKSGVFLTVLGFGMGNYKDSKMEILADKGNGNYAYIDNILEAKKVFIHEFGGTLFTIAKDVKIQIEFNPEIVQAYRLIGYENRKLRDEDFNDDKKDAGELGSGHTVTALYEIIPMGVNNQYTRSIDPLKYQKQTIQDRSKFKDELMTVKLRYKLPDEDQSKLITRIINNMVNDYVSTSDNFRFSAGVAAYGMLLRDSEFKGGVNYEQVLEWIKNAKGKDVEGYRSEFIRMVEATKLLSNS